MKLITKITFIALLAFGVSSCESLDQDSPNSIPTENAFKTVDTAMSWRNGVYKSLRDAN